MKIFNKYFSIIRGAERSGIIEIYPKREDALEDIKSEFKTALGDIDILCIAGTDLFHMSCSIIKRLGRMFVSDANLKLSKKTSNNGFSELLIMLKHYSMISRN